MTPLPEAFACYLDWLATAPPAPEIIRRVRSAGPLRLGADGLAEEGWDDLPPGTLRAGGYDEDRAIYDGPVFAAGAGEEPRTIHLGIDLFAAAGTAVYAPLAGHVHSFQDNANPKDYGPTVILEHTVKVDLTFYTLYGHLSRESLIGLHAGQDVAAGAQLATLGAAEVNGGWPPHLHFQVILDMGSALGDFPGVFKQSERARWKLVCPDPAPLLGIASC